ncbi:hypothetical protein J6590_094238 [Homalodisca vitripennis]|nr:hypothetical protein J6590_094238 [Homalodisca vitripennis]
MAHVILSAISKYSMIQNTTFPSLALKYKLKSVGLCFGNFTKNFSNAFPLRDTHI